MEFNETANVKYRLAQQLLEAENHPYYGMDGESIHASSIEAGTPADIIFRVVASMFGTEWNIGLELSELKITGVPVKLEAKPPTIFTPKKSKFSSFASPRPLPSPKRKIEEVVEITTKRKLKKSKM